MINFVIGLVLVVAVFLGGMQFALRCPAETAKINTFLHLRP